MISILLLCAFALPQSEPPAQVELAAAKPENVAVGVWAMNTKFGGREIPATLTIDETEGELSGTWKSQGQVMDLIDLTFVGPKLSFRRMMGNEGETLDFEGTIDGDAIRGKYSGPFGELVCNGTRGEMPATEEEGESAGEQTADGKPIIQRDGKTLLWANEGAQGGETDYFDMTESAIDPHNFNHGIGRDSIPSIDDPVFVAVDDPKLKELGIDEDTPVIGVSQNGVSKAYPVFIMRTHEIVNDEFAGEPFAVLW